MNDSDSDDSEISDSLRSIVPDDLTTSGLVDGARRKRRRRNGVAGAVAALALVAVAVPVTLNLSANNSILAQPAAPPSAAQAEGPALPGAPACYTPEGNPISRDVGGPDPAGAGAVRAWLCGDYSPETGQGFVGPMEPLTSGIDELLAGVQSEPEVNLATISCLAEYNLSFNVVLEYEDGTQKVVGGDRHGCRLTYDGDVVRENADKFYGEAVTAWKTQRESAPDGVVVLSVCPGPLSLIEMEPWDAVQASLCGVKEDGSWSATHLSDDLVDEVAASMRAASEAPEDEFVTDSTAPEQQIWLTLSNKFTDYQTLVRHEDGIYRAYDGEGLEWFWAPSEGLSARLDEAFAAAGVSDSPPAANPADPSAVPGSDQPEVPIPEEDVAWVSDGCQGISSEDALTSELPDGEMPAGADRIWLCAGDDFRAGISPPMEPLEEAEPLQQVVAAFNTLEPLAADLPCTMELGPSWLVVHEYADGTKYTVKMEEFGCRSVLSGDTVKTDGESSSYRESLLDAWDTQRAMRDTIQTRPGPLCLLSSSLMPVDPKDTTFTAGVACLAADDDAAGGVSEEKPLPADVVALLNGELENARPTLEDVVTAGDALVLVNTSGDPLRLLRLDDGSFTWDDGGVMNSWTLEGEVANKLEELFQR